MRPQIGKRAKKTEPQEKAKTLSREFVETNIRKNLTIREEYLILDDVKTAININAIEQRILTRNKVIALIKRKFSPEKLLEQLVEENHFDRHRMTRLL
ncbi:MAG: hypothetical protein ACLFPE_09120 [Bacteroidales bacterium]